MTNQFEQERDFRFSTLREQMLEHLFIAELMQEVWFGRKQPIEVLRSEVDSGGYDLAVECNGITRHIQLKSSRAGPQTRRPSISLELSNKPSGCVVWLTVDVGVTGRKAVIDYRFFGSDPGKPLPDMSRFVITKHTRANAQGVKRERPGHRRVPIRCFERVSNIQELTNKLFGLPKKEFTL